MFRRFLFSRIWSSARDHALLFLLLNLVGFFVSTRPRWSCGNDLYHSCTSFEEASRGGQPLNIFTWFIGVGGMWTKRKTRETESCTNIGFVTFRWPNLMRGLLKVRGRESVRERGCTCVCVCVCVHVGRVCVGECVPLHVHRITPICVSHILLHSYVCHTHYYTHMCVTRQTYECVDFRAWV